MKEFKHGEQLSSKDVYFEKAIAAAQHLTLNSFGETEKAQLRKAVSLFSNCISEKKAMIFFGNGGSAAEAAHLAAEFSGKCVLDHDPWHALALNDLSSSVTAIANDYGYEHVFSRPLLGMISSVGLAIGLTTSGTSPNIVNALRVAKVHSIPTILMTGDITRLESHEVLEYSDLVLSVNSKITPRIQEIHLLWGHLISEMIEVELSNQ